MREAISFTQFAEAVARLDETRGRHIERIGIPVELAHSTIGALPTVAVVSVTQGMDWDAGTLMLSPQQPLTPLTPDELAEIKRCRQEGQSWAIYKAHERWQGERNGLVDTINKLRTALLQRGMSTEELNTLAGVAPTIRPRKRKP